MWVCVKSINRDIQLVGIGDTKEEILGVMYEDFSSVYPSEEIMNNDINHDNAEFCDSDCFAWSNYRDINRDWKCFWV